jgi:hypothetical protein
MNIQISAPPNHGTAKNSRSIIALDNRITSNHSYGYLYENVADQSYNLTDSYTGWTGATGPVSTLSNITVGYENTGDYFCVTNDGVYKVDCHISIKRSTNDKATIHAHIFVNGVEMGDIGFITTLTNQLDSFSSSVIGLLVLALKR